MLWHKRSEGAIKGLRVYIYYDFVDSMHGSGVTRLLMIPGPI